MNRHVLHGKHKFAMERTNIQDHALDKFIGFVQMEGEDRRVVEPSVIGALSTAAQTRSSPKPGAERGYALRKTKIINRFSDNAKNFLPKFFKEGTADKNKRYVPEQATKEMKVFVNPDGSKFTRSEWLSPRQIKSYWSSMERAKNKPPKPRFMRSAIPVVSGSVLL